MDPRAAGPCRPPGRLHQHEPLRGPRRAHIAAGPDIHIAAGPDAAAVRVGRALAVRVQVLRSHIGLEIEELGEARRGGGGGAELVERELARAWIPIF